MEICSDLKGHTHRWIWVRIPQVSMASDPMAWGSYPDPSPLCGEYYAKEKKKIAQSSRQTTPGSRKAEESETKGIPEGKKREAMCSCRPERLCFLTKDYFRGAHRLGAASHFHYRTPTPTPPRHLRQNMSNSGAENSNSSYSLYSMSQGQCHMTSKSCHCMESCETKKTVYPNTVSEMNPLDLMKAKCCWKWIIRLALNSLR